MILSYEPTSQCFIDTSNFEASFQDQPNIIRSFSLDDYGSSAVLYLDGKEYFVFEDYIAAETWFKRNLENVREL